METSIIVPAYNEETRIKPFLKKLIVFTSDLKDYEVIIVNDGSRDNTLDLVRSLIPKKNYKLLSYRNNKGKGYAIKKGVEVAKGEKILFIDADGAILPNEIPKMLRGLDEYEVVVGNRKMNKEEVTRKHLRKLMAFFFNSFARTLFGVKEYDFLCGFKGFQSRVAKKIFNNLKSYGWIFDVEIFYKAEKLNCSIKDIAIKWEEKEGSKIRTLDPLKMFFQLFSLRLKV